MHKTVGPDTTLCSDDVLLLVGSQSVLVWVEVVHTLNAWDAGNLVKANVAEVEVLYRSDNCWVSSLGSTYSGLGACPADNGNVLRRCAVENLIPTNHLSAACTYVLCHLVHKPCLQLVFLRVAIDVLQSQLGNLGLAVGTLLPTVLRTLVATDVDVVRREDVHNLVDNVLGKLQCLGLAGTHNLIYNAEVLAYLVRTAGAAEVVVGCKGSLHVARHINLGDNGDVAFGSVAYNLACVVLCVVARNRHVVVLARVGGGDGARALRANLCKLRILLYFNAPALVLGEVPVEVVDVVHGEHVDELLEVVDAEEVATAVDHKRTVGKARSVADVGCRQRYLLGVLNDRQSLHDGLQAIEHASVCCAFKHNGLLRHVETISLVAAGNVGNAELNLVVCLTGCCGNIDAGYFLYV